MEAAIERCRNLTKFAFLLLRLLAQIIKREGTEVIVEGREGFQRSPQQSFPPHPHGQGFETFEIAGRPPRDCILDLGCDIRGHTHASFDQSRAFAELIEGRHHERSFALEAIGESLKERPHLRVEFPLEE